MATEFKDDYQYVEAGTIDVSQLKPLDDQTSKIMKGEFSTGMKLTSLYFVFILGLPTLNWFAKDFMFSRMWGGMTYSWFLTSIVAMALAFIMAWVHTALYEKRLKQYGNLDSTKSGEGRDIV